MLSSRRRTEPGCLLERDHVLARIAAAAAFAAEGAGQLVVVSGPAGIGKTCVLDSALSSLREADFRLLRARGAETESSFAFAGALQLLERAVGAPSGASALSGSAELARPVFAGHFLTGEGGPLASAVHGLFWLTVNLAAAGPLALVVDDLHALDEPTLRYLLYLQRRIDDLPVLLLVATRPSETQARPALSELVLAPGVQELSLEPLSSEAVTELVRREFHPGAEEEFCRACLRVSGGNPFLLQEALRELSAEGTPATAEGARRLTDVEPQAIGRAVLLRLARLTEREVRLAQAAAVLGGGAPLGVAAEVAGLELAAAMDAADALVGASILRAIDPPEFTHALITAAIAGDFGAGQRRRLHVAAADALLARHAPADRIAPHLLSSPPTGEGAHIDVLVSAAEGALVAGAPATAAAYLERILQEGGLGRERRAELLSMLARAQLGIAPQAASEQLTEAVRLAPPGERGARLQLELGRALYVAGRHEEAARVFISAAESLDSESGLARELVAWFASASVFVESFRPRARELVERLAHQPPTDLTPGERTVLANAALETVMHGGPLREVRHLADLAWGEGALLAQETCDGYAWMHVTALYLWGGDPLHGQRVAEAVLEDARRRGSVMAFATASWITGSAKLFRGHLLDSLADIEQTLEVHRRDGWQMFIAGARWVQVEALLARGELKEAAAAATALEPEQFAGSGEGALLRYARGRVALAENRPADAVAELRAARAQAERLGFTPVRMLPIWGPLALALARLGEREQALAELEVGEAAARRAELPAVVAELLVVRAELRPDAAANELLREAVTLADASQSLVERARARMALGSWLRRSGRRREALSLLRESLDLAHRAGAAPLEDGARAELAILGSRPRRTRQWGIDGLTASELRTVRLAAEGRTNRQIAEALFVTPKTVEYHLRNAFVKLDVSSRTQLAALLDEEDGE